jgi:glycosyltransferase involved in cell wall biosynthesis
MAEQTVPPSRWVVVDDGSTDATPQILAEAMKKHSFIRVVKRQNRGVRAVGPGVIEAFYAGLETVENLDDYEYLCKLDGDLELPPRYFEILIEKMEDDPYLGTVSGKVYLRDETGKLSHERRGNEVSVGPSKFYRVECFRDIGGFVRAAGWDGIDGHMCRLKGWIAKSMDVPELRIIHRRQMGSSQRGVLTGRIRGGGGKRFIGSSLIYVLASTVYRLFDRPYVIGGLFMLYGYLRAMITNAPRFGDGRYRKHLRRYEWDVLLMGKRRALRKQERRIRSEPSRTASSHRSRPISG